MPEQEPEPELEPDEAALLTALPSDSSFFDNWTQPELNFDVWKTVWGVFVEGSTITETQLHQVAAGYLRRLELPPMTLRQSERCARLFETWTGDLDVNGIDGLREKVCLQRIRDDSTLVLPIVHPRPILGEITHAIDDLAKEGELPAREHFSCDPFSRRGAAWRVEESLKETNRMCTKMTELRACGVATRQLRVALHEKALDRLLDISGDLDEYVAQINREVRDDSETVGQELVGAIEAERQAIRETLGNAESERQRAEFVARRLATEKVTAEVKELRHRFRDALKPLPTMKDDAAQKLRLEQKWRMGAVKAVSTARWTAKPSKSNQDINVGMTDAAVSYFAASNRWTDATAERKKQNDAHELSTAHEIGEAVAQVAAEEARQIHELMALADVPNGVETSATDVESRYREHISRASAVALRKENQMVSEMARKETVL